LPGTAIAAAKTSDGTNAATISPDARVNTASTISSRLAMSLRNGAERSSQKTPYTFSTTEKTAMSTTGAAPRPPLAARNPAIAPGTATTR
jgi:hypothetical protein